MPRPKNPDDRVVNIRGQYVQWTVMVTPEQKTWIESAAAHAGLSMVAWFREVLDDLRRLDERPVIEHPDKRPAIEDPDKIAM
jgi:hypothetical protein